MDKCLFKEWGVKNNRTDLLDRWDYEKNNRNIDDVCLYSRGKFWFRCENHDVHGSHQYCLASLAHNKESQFKCPICNSLKKNYVESKGYHYLELPYFSINNDNYKKLIDDSINNIIQNL